MKTLGRVLAKAADTNALNAGGDYEAREWFACAHSLTMARDEGDYDVALRHACRAVGIAALAEKWRPTPADEAKYGPCAMDQRGAWITADGRDLEACKEYDRQMEAQA